MAIICNQFGITSSSWRSWLDVLSFVIKGTASLSLNKVINLFTTSSSIVETLFPEDDDASVWITVFELFAVYQDNAAHHRAASALCDAAAAQHNQ